MFLHNLLTSSLTDYIYLYRGLANDHRGREYFYCHLMLEFLCKENKLIKCQDVRTSNSGVREP